MADRSHAHHPASRTRVALSAPISITSVFANSPCISAMEEMRRIRRKRGSSCAECGEKVIFPLFVLAAEDLVKDEES
jgi:hypothetical protein